MPLNKGAKPGSKGFGENIKTEIAAGKPAKQAQAIAYSEAKDKIRVSRDAKGQMHVYLPGLQFGKLLGSGMAGIVRTVARGDKTISLMRKGLGDKPKDMRRKDFEEMTELFAKFMGEEAAEPEHNADCKGGDSCDCGCNH